MSDEATLFQHDAFEKFKETAVASYTERTVRDHWITIDGEKYSVENINDTLDAVGGEDVVVRDDKYGKLFLKLGVLSSLGSSRWYMSASLGPNWKAFREVIDERLKDMK